MTSFLSYISQFHIISDNLLNMMPLCDYFLGLPYHEILFSNKSFQLPVLSGFPQHVVSSGCIWWMQPPGMEGSSDY